MGKPILLLRLEGPLQSWGGRSRWDVRDTQTEPTKSGVMGLLGCARGLPVGDAGLEEMDRALRFGVRVEAPGRIREDYQTVTGFLPTAGGGYKHSGVAVATSLERLRANPDATPATIISPRFYLEDAAFLVALESRTPEYGDLLAACADAVQDPVWPLFLGRKACVPSRPVFEYFGSDKYDSIECALKRHPWSWLRSRAERRPFPERPPAAYVEADGGALIRQDALRVNPSRQYDFISLSRVELEEVPK